MFCLFKLTMPPFFKANEDDNSVIPNQFTGKVYRKYTDGNKEKMPSVTCRIVSHTQQQFNWDCGLSCVLMALDAADEFTAKEDISSDIEKVCKAEGFGHSTWTIDLCYLLKHYAPHLNFSYTTIMKGVDPSYKDQVFYNKILHRDSDRVQDRFDNAQQNGIYVEEKSVTMKELVQHISDLGTIIVLTNANLLSCETCSYFKFTGKSDNSIMTSCFLVRNSGSSAYQGHYVLAIGYDLPKKKVYYRNPSLRDRVCCMSFERFDEARNAYGTDKDLIFVQAAANEDP